MIFIQFGQIIEYTTYTKSDRHCSRTWAQTGPKENWMHKMVL
jgi:hypothetical protein